MKSVRVLFAALFVLLLGPTTAPAQPASAAKPSLIGRWDLQQWSSFSPAESAMRPWVAFKPNGAVEASDGCYSYSGHYRTAGLALTIEPLQRLPGGCGFRNDRYFDPLTKFFALSLARDGRFNLVNQTLNFNTTGGEGFSFRSSGPARAAVAPPSGGGARALVRSDFVRMDERRECDPDLDEPMSIKIMCMAANQRLSSCRVDGPSSPDLDRAAQCLARMSKLKPGIDGLVTFKIGAR
jgi:hypothetical protein